MTALLVGYGKLVDIDPKHIHAFTAYLAYKRQQNPYRVRGLSWLLVLGIVGLGS